jgi:hypothetical protein
MRAIATHTAQGKKGGSRGKRHLRQHRRGWPLLAPALRRQQPPRAPHLGFGLAVRTPWFEGHAVERTVFVCVLSVKVSCFCVPPKDKQHAARKYQLSKAEPEQMTEIRTVSHNFLTSLITAESRRTSSTVCTPASKFKGWVGGINKFCTTGQAALALPPKANDIRLKRRGHVLAALPILSNSE